MPGADWQATLLAPGPLRAYEEINCFEQQLTEAGAAREHDRARPELFDTLSAWRERGEIKPAEYAHERENAEQLVVRWFAPGVGLVKEQIGSAIIRVLTGIEKEGTGLTDTTRLEQYEIQG